eukprot:Tbor_TRINITY_DN4358_c0_g1::TRINITY_DN4358_c0_g1_i1::g.7858::m.7858
MWILNRGKSSGRDTDDSSDHRKSSPHQQNGLGPDQNLPVLPSSCLPASETTSTPQSTHKSSATVAKLDIAQEYTRKYYMEYLAPHGSLKSNSTGDSPEKNDEDTSLCVSSPQTNQRYSSKFMYDHCRPRAKK